VKSLNVGKIHGLTRKKIMKFKISGVFSVPLSRPFEKISTIAPF